eukprot:1138905-Pelagomonas_calceolata.AAC.1
MCALLPADDSQVNEHPIAKDERRTVKLTHSLSPPRKREDNIGDLDLMSETSDSPLGKKKEEKPTRAKACVH